MPTGRCVKESFLDAIRIPLARLVATERCLACGGHADAPHPLCDRCAESLFASRAAESLQGTGPDARCDRCGRSLISAVGRCRACRESDVLARVDRVVALFPYVGLGPRLVRAWKTAGYRSLAAVWARCLASVLAAPPLAGIPVIPVPPRPGKLARKGWDQVEDLARRVEECRLAPVLRALERRAVVEQKGLGRAERRRNIGGMIAVSRGAQVPRRVIVLDDVMTTGSTLDACADALKEAGVDEVYGLVLFFD